MGKPIPCMMRRNAVVRYGTGFLRTSEPGKRNKRMGTVLKRH